MLHTIFLKCLKVEVPTQIQYLFVATMFMLNLLSSKKTSFSLIVIGAIAGKHF